MVAGNPKPPRSLYVHVPFCHHRCGYCNFALIADRADLVDRYLDALEFEVNQWVGEFELDTLFLGGGTPSYLSSRQWLRLAEVLFQRFAFSGDFEFTAECNPNDLQKGRLDAMLEAGVNRLSLGVQSFDDRKLKFLERTHTRADAIDSIQRAKVLLDKVSIDLIFACPDEWDDTWQSDLDTAVSLQIDHVSTYELTYEKGTRFWNRLNRGELLLVPADHRAKLYECAINTLTAAGWEQYEVSSFAKPEHRCRHNQVYWNGDSFLAAGPGASRFLGGVRETNHRSTTRYMQLLEANQSPVAEGEALDARSLAKDRIAFGLRLLDGVKLGPFREMTGFDLIDFLGDLGVIWRSERLLTINRDVCQLTPQGVMVYDAIASEIYALD
ncbi:MAG: radical SAM family heme chaperone HemW [Mariniblastus sp.]|nr:radical SAM family heme chaperone HemW [Mariniblastus sp.]